MTNPLIEFIRQGGFQFMVPLICLSILALAVILERAYVLNRRVLMDARRWDRIRENIGSGETEAARAELENDKTLTGVILRDAVLMNGKGRTWQDAVEQSADRHIDFLETRLWLLKAVGHLAPLIGLTGTVVGLAAAFGNIAQEGLGQEQVAGGISMALNTTITGLAVAIPTLFAEYGLRARARGLFKKIKNLLDELIAAGTA